MRIIADTHTHTIASTHAYSTAQEMIAAAAEKGLYAIALTDHGYAMPGSPGKWFFESLGAIPSTYNGVRVLKGVEANILDKDGTLDMTDEVLADLEWVVASIHGLLWKGKPSVEAVTNAYLNLAKNPNVNVIGHSGTPKFKYDYNTVIPELARNGKLIEINDNTFFFRKSSCENCVEIAKTCKKFGAYVVVNSDAHFSSKVGHFSCAIEMLNEIDFPQELIINSDEIRFKKYLEQNGISLV
ncbi:MULTISPECIES: phosphatase [unclassified Ruminococcus]|uniref:phosphatase n=1 Tax=unclassified Ruminococcus TaxID=2608920 RepID=UPI00210CE74D|nr:MULTISPECIES: phosphatase [unclassified Ruminococcus]MCQ4022244.1 PHP domain-containing protein [Ruminococcus sp. zg-924]MCQ4114572.1 PHP domain-containing protein [Ruminococcus sp. zg-921]